MCPHTLEYEALKLWDRQLIVVLAENTKNKLHLILQY